ncbi:outer membrane protein assembly factor BamB family protein [Planosporangium mesophilum]|uniref:Pyrrolo-quinoline quinone repeat domain-containing protein n=1 Tax=Planosporangium mesophilum TaxID=689768 RepID=A0A8J3T5X2_9ACTN|nr:PQQ-binding-like beta-propeller repeat protein [Planosporangium mesophilum]NJC81854.1 PQQ-binding-like beta-propeller repeat protein [Planosporangium mesophilum]GII20484.1 hypothetical protein Pme01_00810 [Planosporangium mesophilum]
MGQAAEPLIDLGELTGAAPSADDEGRPRVPARLVLLLVAVLVAAGLPGDAALIPLRPVLTTPFTPTDFDMGDDVLYLFDGSYAPNRVLAHRLRDGKRLWQVGSPATASYETVRQVGGRTLFVPDPCTAPGSVSTVAVDTASGREVWRRPGTAEWLVSGGTLVVMARPHFTYGCGTGLPATPVHWDAVNVATGALAWSVEVPEVDRISLDSGRDGSRWVVFVARDGTVVVRDLLTGAVTAQTVLPELARPAPPGGHAPALGGDVVPAPDLLIVGNQALLLRRPAIRFGGGPAVLDITAYDVAGLTRRWDVRVDVGPSDLRGSAGYVDLAACGPMLCLRGQLRTVFLDPRDGAQRWRSSLRLLATSGDRAVLADARAGNAADETAPGGLTVRDVRTGQERGIVPGWRVLTADLRRQAAPLLGVTLAGRTWFARLDLARLRVVTLGSAPGRYGSCLAEPEYFACRGIDGSVRVWRSWVAPRL